MDQMKHILDTKNKLTKQNLSISHDRRKQKTKQAIHYALLQLLQTKQLTEITIKELTIFADVNRKTFYNHYSCLEDVIYEIERNITDRIKIILNDQSTLCLEEKWDSLLFVDEITNEIYKQHKSLRILLNGNTKMHLFSQEHQIMNEIFEICQQKKPDFFKSLVPYYEIISATIFTMYQTWVCTEPELLTKEALSKFIKEYILFCRNFNIVEEDLMGLSNQ